MRYYDAIHFTLKAHDGQMRKLEGDIYAAHPIEVGFILSECDVAYEVIIAGILHDTLEDTTATYSLLKNRFGNKVARLVKGVSEDDKSLNWKTRKQKSINHLKNEASKEEKYIICADKLSNIKSFSRSLKNIENPQESFIWKKFNAGYKKQKWYYKESLKGLKELKGKKIYEELSKYIKKVFN